MTSETGPLFWPSIQVYASRPVPVTSLFQYKILRGMQESASDTSGSKGGILGSLGEISTSANPS